MTSGFPTVTHIRVRPAKKSKYSVSELKHASLVLQYDRSEGEAVVPDFLQEDREVYVPDFAREEDESIRQLKT